MHQVAVGAVDLHAVGACRDGGRCGAAEVVDGRGDLLRRQRAGCRHLLGPGRGEHRALRLDRRRGDRLAAVGGVVGVGDASGVHQLDDDPAVGRVHGVGDLAPPGDLLVIVDAGGEEVALAVGVGLGALGDDERVRGPLGVVLGVQLGRYAFRGGAVTGHGGHDQAVREGDVADEWSVSTGRSAWVVLRCGDDRVVIGMSGGCGGCSGGRDQSTVRTSLPRTCPASLTCWAVAAWASG